MTGALTLNIEKKRMFIRELLDAHAGEFFTVTFRKGNGEERVMNGRTGVTKHLKGGVSTTAGKPHLYNCYDTVAKGYRSFTIDTVTQLKISGVTLNFPTPPVSYSVAA